MTGLDSWPSTCDMHWWASAPTDAWCRRAQRPRQGLPLPRTDVPCSFLKQSQRYHQPKEYPQQKTLQGNITMGILRWLLTCLKPKHKVSMCALPMSCTTGHHTHKKVPRCEGVAWPTGYTQVWSSVELAHKPHARNWASGTQWPTRGMEFREIMMDNWKFIIHEIKKPKIKWWLTPNQRPSFRCGYRLMLQPISHSWQSTQNNSLPK